MRKAPDHLREHISLRPAAMPDDEAFLEELYANSRDDLNGLIRDQSQLRQLLLMQYNGQKATYSAEFPDAEHYIVLLDGERVGRLIVDRRPDAIHGVDLAILKSSRNLGVGTGILAGILAECSVKGVPLTFSVVKTNPAVRLYQRLGCRIADDMGTHFSMVWTPKSPE